MKTDNIKGHDTTGEIDVARLEKGMYNPSLKLAMDIAAVLDKTVEEVFFFKEK